MSDAMMGGIIFFALFIFGALLIDPFDSLGSRDSYTSYMINKAAKWLAIPILFVLLILILPDGETSLLLNIGDGIAEIVDAISGIVEEIYIYDYTPQELEIIATILFTLLSPLVFFILGKVLSMTDNLGVRLFFKIIIVIMLIILIINLCLAFILLLYLAAVLLFVVLLSGGVMFLSTGQQLFAELCLIIIFSYIIYSIAYGFKVLCDRK